jgi:TolB-like protein
MQTARLTALICLIGANFNIYAQDDTRPTIAILDFEGQGISVQEVQTLTERMRTEIGNTNAVRLIERNAIESIMAEQGLTQSGCVTDECAAQVGQLLGVQFMINGSIGKIGDSFTIDVKMFSVETGATERSKNVTHDGDIEGLLVEMQILAWEIVGLSVPPALKLKRGGETEKPTVAVLDFEGRGISMMEAQTLTDRFMTAMANTDRVRLVDRATMGDVLSEQGFSSTECASDECAAEVGAMLGVQLMVNGSIGKIGNTYTIDAKMFSVATGAAESMKNLSYQGEVDGLIIEMEILSWEILGLQVPKELQEKRRLGTQAYLQQKAGVAPKTQVGALVRGVAFPGLGHLYANNQKWAYRWIGTEAVMGGLIYAAYSSYQSATNDYDNHQVLYQAETDIDLIIEHKQNRDNSKAEIESANGQLTILAGIAGTIWAASAVHAYLNGPGSEKKKREKKEKKAEPEPAVEEQALSRVDINLAYDPTLQQAQLKFSVPLN